MGHRLRAVAVPVEPMSAAAFAPFGHLLATPERPPDARVVTPHAFRCDGQTVVSTIWQPAAERGFTRLERHFGVEQSFFQLSGSPSVVCVAEKTALDDPSAVPAAEDVRAFLIDPGVGYAFHVGTWHSLDRLVLAPPGATFVMLNVAPNPSQLVDYATGESVRYADLDVDAEPDRQVLEGTFGRRFVLTL